MEAPLISKALRIRLGGRSGLSAGPDAVDIEGHATEPATNLNHTILINAGFLTYHLDQITSFQEARTSK